MLKCVMTVICMIQCVIEADILTQINAALLAMEQSNTRKESMLLINYDDSNVIILLYIVSVLGKCSDTKINM